MVAYTLYYIIGGALLLILAITFMFRLVSRRKKARSLANVIPDSILKDFEEAERRYKLENKDGNGNPYKILWELWRERNPIITEGESGIETDNRASTDIGNNKQSTKIQPMDDGESRQDVSGNKQYNRRIERI